MMFKRSACAFVIAAALWANTTPAQQMQPSGMFTPGHTVRVLNSGGTAVGDAGGAAGSTNAQTGFLTEIGITNTGTPFCINDALTNANGGYHELCVGANALGGGLLSYNAYQGAPPLSFQININGVNYPFPGGAGSGTVVGPVSSTIGDVAIWANTSGTLLAQAQALLGITAQTTYYVNASGSVTSPCGAFTCQPGSDSNTGTSPSAPWQHLTYAANYVTTHFTPLNATVFIQAANGIYSENVVLPPWVGVYARDSTALTATASQITIIGNNSNPATVAICASSGPDISENGSFGGEWQVTGVKLSSDCGATDGIFLDWSANMTVGNLTCEVVGTCMNVRYGSQLELVGGATVRVLGPAFAFATAVAGAKVIAHGQNLVTITMVSTPNFTGAFVQKDETSFLDLTTATFTGSATGVKFFLGGTNQGLVAANIYAYPGNIAGEFQNRQVYGQSINGTIYVNGSNSPANCGGQTCQPGDDTSGDGMSITRPFKTINYAVQWIYANVDSVAREVIVQAADTTYTAGFFASEPLPGGGYLLVEGNNTTPDNCILQTTTDAIDATDNAKLEISGFNITTSTGSTSALAASTGGRIDIVGKMDFGSVAGAHMFAQTGGRIFFGSNYTISGGANAHYQAQNGGLIQIAGTGITATLTGTPAFANGFAVGQELGDVSVSHSGMTFSGGATGVRYNATLNGVINTLGGGGTFFPGNSAGTTASGGQYN